MARPGPAALWLVRHGESQGNLADARAAETGADRLDLDIRNPDVPLSATGRSQAEALGARLGELPADQRPTAVLSSPFLRAADTARTALRVAGIDLPVRLDERLRERDLGAFDGLTGSGIRAEHPEEARRREQLGKFYYRPPGGESWADVALRVRSLLTHAELHLDGERLLVASHEAVILLFRYVVEGLTEKEVLDIGAGERMANASLTRYELGDDGVLHLAAYDEVEHLSRREDAEVTEEADVR